MYTKLNFKLDNLNYSRLKGTFLEGYGETFKQYNIKDKEYLEELLSDKIKFNIAPSWVTCCEITDYGATPHTDHNSVSLNYYIDASDYITIFWETKKHSNGKAADQIINEDGITRKNDVKLYDYNELKIVSKFKAHSHEAYLLDIKQIHSANKIIPDSQIRTMIRWSWDNYNFDTIKNSIEIVTK